MRASFKRVLSLIALHLHRGPLPPGPLERRQMRMQWVEQKIAGSGKTKASQQHDDGVGNQSVASNDTAVPQQENDFVKK